MALEKQKSTRNENTTNSSKTAVNSESTVKNIKIQEDDVLLADCPEYCFSKKEKDCWRLYQKMLNKGVSVSYDTILRGMLTPTELRAAQKQREITEEKEKENSASAESEKL